MTAAVSIEPKRLVDLTPRATLPPPERRETVFDIRGLTASYGSVPAISDVSIEIYENLVTAVIGPSGCG
jgi:ABC-type glutathione transport system ATPase component